MLTPMLMPMRMATSLLILELPSLVQPEKAPGPAGTAAVSTAVPRSETAGQNSLQQQLLELKLWVVLELPSLNACCPPAVVYMVACSQLEAILFPSQTAQSLQQPYLLHGQEIWLRYSDTLVAASERLALGLIQPVEDCLLGTSLRLIQPLAVIQLSQSIPNPRQACQNPN